MYICIMHKREKKHCPFNKNTLCIVGISAFPNSQLRVQVCFVCLCKRECA